MLVVAVLAGLVLLAPGPSGAAASPAAPAAVSAAPAGASGGPGEPSLAVESEPTPTGAVTVVVLDHWPSGPVTVQACGNGGVRASQDCDLVGAKTVGVPPEGDARVYLALTPPVGCPCVVRASTAGQELVRTLPVTLPGVPVLPAEQQGPDPFRRPRGRDLEVSARLDPGPASWPGLVRGSLERELVLAVANTGSDPMTGLSLDVAVGREAGTGAVVAVPELADLAPGERRTLRVPVTVDGPAAGRFVVSGRVRGLEDPVRFEAETEHRPVALLGLVAVVLALLLGLAVAGRRRRRRVAVREASDPSSAPGGEDARPVARIR